MSTEEQLLARLEAAGLLARFVVHELNNALTELAGSLELLAEDARSVEVEHLRDELLNSVDGVTRGLGSVRGVLMVLRALSPVASSSSSSSQLAVEQDFDPRLLAELGLALARPELAGIHVVRRYERGVTTHARPLEAARAFVGALGRALEQRPSALAVVTSAIGATVTLDDTT